ncbi:MAG TPA: cupin domain-containing protein [Actinophytocola sp.]|uniref:cupin domain-containing protein n=1 Tax=Actinophytocola sp. TaxID=1872138 RepID=UPI002DDD5534|nr:cupin domain-containing protein [Actinophytocola sp.]HEV2782185.1 cupin domain-containing protein [Actinophytocola sp.]
MTVIRAADAPRFSLPGVEFTGLAAPSRGSADICTWRLTVAPSRDRPEPHTLDKDEVFMVISGSVRVTPDGPELGTGDAMVVPAGSPIALVNTGDTAAELYVAIRAGFVGTMADGTTVRPPWAQ